MVAIPLYRGVGLPLYWPVALAAADGVALSEITGQELPTAVVGRSPRELAWRRFRGNKTGVFTLVIAAFLILSTTFAPLLKSAFGLDPELVITI